MPAVLNDFQLALAALIVDHDLFSRNGGTSDFLLKESRRLPAEAVKIDLVLKALKAHLPDTQQHPRDSQGYHRLQQAEGLLPHSPPLAKSPIASFLSSACFSCFCVK